MPRKTDLSRQERKAKKRAAEGLVPDVPIGLEPAPDRCSPDPQAQKARKRKRDTADDTAATGLEKSKKSKKDRKRGRAAPAADALAEPAPPTTRPDPAAADPDAVDPELRSKKGKKERKAERRAAKLAAAAVDATAPAPGPPAKSKNNRNRDKKRLAATAQSSAATPARFIVFVGNLPFTATQASITAHFAKLKPVSVRNLTQKDDPQKSRGMAFVEFASFDTHKTALKTMHHSTFDDGISDPRKINVELTVGGGGNTDERKAKIKSKNERLDEQRLRRAQEEAKAKSAKSTASEKDKAADETSAIHPSRRNMVSV